MRQALVQSASQYRWFAEQCVARAQSATSSEEAAGYLQWAAVWRRLADGRDQQAAGFVRRSLRKQRDS